MVGWLDGWLEGWTDGQLGEGCTFWLPIIDAFQSLGSLARLRAPFCFLGRFPSKAPLSSFARSGCAAAGEQSSGVESRAQAQQARRVASRRITSRPVAERTRLHSRVPEKEKSVGRAGPTRPPRLT